MARILVAYATKHGSTAGIAEAIGKELMAAGLSVEVKEIKNVQSPAGYDAVVIGGPIYMGKVMDEVKKFIARHQEKLTALPVAAFIIGLSPASTDEKQIEAAQKALRDAVAPLQPVSSAMFAGSLDPGKLGFIERKMIGMVKSPTGDFRDWDAISAWAKRLPSLLVKG
jgi:menaquinone-dependent protoporphyrinogen oxidase